MPGTVLSSEVSAVFTFIAQIKKPLDQGCHPDSGSDTVNLSVVLVFILG